MTANIIILNGCSSSGKTTLAEKLQQVLPAPYQHISLDQFRDGMPMRVRGLNAPEGTEGQLGLNVVPEQRDGEWLTHIQMGEYADSVLSAMRATVAYFATANIPVIVDDLLLKPRYLEEYAKFLDPRTTWLIGVYCAPELVEARERAREGRFPGTAKAHFELVHAHCTSIHGSVVPNDLKDCEGYDLVVDTGKLSPRQAAQQIVERIKQPPAALQAC